MSGEETIMDTLATLLALHGAAILTISLFAGLFLYRTILGKGAEHDWHLLHAGGSGRGLMLFALAATIHLPALPAWLTWILAWLVILFAWASTLAMIITAVTGERGFGWSGTVTNRLTFGLYVIGTVAVFPAFLVLMIGLAIALQT